MSLETLLGVFEGTCGQSAWAAPSSVRGVWGARYWPSVDSPVIMTGKVMIHNVWTVNTWNTECNPRRSELRTRETQTCPNIDLMIPGDF